MASGLAVLAYDYAAAATLIRNGVSGLLVPLQGTDFAAQAAALALEPERARRLGEHARREALARRWERVAAELEAVLAAAAVHASAKEPLAMRTPRAAPASTSLG
jgi:glycosyltransferase involved in cell wall biosynthesis